MIQKKLLFLLCMLTLNGCAITHQQKVTEQSPSLPNETQPAPLVSNETGYTKLADNNGYPGPKHVLEFADKLQLTAEQIEQSQIIYDDMQKYADELEEKLARKQAALEYLFKNSKVNDDNMALLLSEMGILEVKLRYVHMRAHLQQQAILSPKQIQQYQQLRQHTH